MRKIAITIPDGLSDHDAEILVRDALSNFIGARRDPEAYVATRYPEWDVSHRAEKVIEVARRVKFAREMQDNVRAIEVQTWEFEP